MGGHRGIAGRLRCALGLYAALLRTWPTAGVLGHARRRDAVLGFSGILDRRPCLLAFPPQTPGTGHPPAERKQRAWHQDHKCKRHGDDQPRASSGERNRDKRDDEHDGDGSPHGGRLPGWRPDKRRSVRGSSSPLLGSGRLMRVVVVGASGNVGTSVLRELTDEPAVESIVGLCRRVPKIGFPKVEWRAADVATSQLAPHFRGADAVVHLAWLIQPGRDRNLTRRVNVLGSERVFRAVSEAAVPTLVYASSVGAYGHGPKDRRVDESWPTTGTESSFYARDKATVERLLDRFEREHPGVRTVRLRPGLIFSREAASEIRRLFAGPLLPGSLVRRRLIPIVPKVERLVFQAVHSRDVARAYRLAITGDAAGAFNIAADPVIDGARLAELFSARQVRLSPRLVRAAASGRLPAAPPALRARLARHGARGAADGHEPRARAARLGAAPERGRRTQRAPRRAP